MRDPSASTVDLTNCDREPIHLLGTVQPFGFLIAVSVTDWLVERVSQNISRWIDAKPEDLLGKPIHEVIQGNAVHAIRGNLHSAIMGNTTARLFGLDLAAGLTCDVAVHLVENTVIIECEPTSDDSSFNAAATVQGMIARLLQTDNDRAFYRIAAREVRALTGFDRVMVYRFDQDGAGEVIAESARSGIDSYLGLHYPASDIPRQARQLYERNWLRIIADVNAAPSPIEPQLDKQRRPLDLSMSTLRSVSTIHIEYLQNMGVQSSMSVSILCEGRLWGLFACHHYSAHCVSFGRRTAAELFGQMFSLLMENRERKAEAEYEGRGQTLHQRLITMMAGEGLKFESIVAHLDDIADLLTCDGIALWMNDHAILRGRTPGEAQLTGLVHHLKSKDITRVYAQHDISSEYPAGQEFAERSAGMLIVPLSRTPRDYLIFFREEAARHVNWAGDPSKPVTAGPLGDRLTPRKSFELWKETVRGQSRPWKPVECRIAENLRVSMIEVILHLSDVTAEERRRGQQRQELLIAELNHRIRNILGLIRGVISQSKDPGHTVESFTTFVGGRIQALARAHDQITAEHWGPGSFQALLKGEAAAYISGKTKRLIFKGPDALIAPEALTTLALVMHEMITNSAKYGALSDSRGRVEISTSFDQLSRFAIEWSELGGPPVRAPTRRGFGSTVIERSIAHDLKGEARLEFALAGLRAYFLIPAAYVVPAVEAMQTAPVPAQDMTPGAPIPGEVLVVEDNLIIALDTEDMLRKIGVNTVRIVGGVAEALKLIEDRLPDFALLDVNLGEETSFDIAERLAARGSPFAFTSGYGEPVAFPDKFSHVQRLRKPYSIDLLRALLTSSP
jgi:light-regulated signal transduction histidine kinase (bacteriophytochrome)/CheY-like chemotaxis protein